MGSNEREKGGLKYFGRKVQIKDVSDDRLRAVADRCASILERHGLYFRIWSEEPEREDGVIAPPRVYIGRDPNVLRKPANWMRGR